MITIQLNGEKKEIQGNLTIQDFLQRNHIQPQEIVIEYNFEIIQREKFKEIILQNGDQLEVLKFVGGG